MNPYPTRGEVWLTDMDPVVGHEQAGRRPCVVVSNDLHNSSPRQLVAVIPLTSRDRGIPLHIQIEPPEGNLREVSFAMPEMIRSISTLRLVRRWGVVSAEVLQRIEANTKAFLDFR